MVLGAKYMVLYNKDTNRKNANGTLGNADDISSGVNVRKIRTEQGFAVNAVYASEVEQLIFRYCHKDLLDATLHPNLKPGQFPLVTTTKKVKYTRFKNGLTLKAQVTGFSLSYGLVLTGFETSCKVPRWTF